MIMKIRRLTISCKKSVEDLPLSHISYFHGPVGTGKSTIVRLIDYCLGSRHLTMTPALQSEFVGASLELTAGNFPVIIMRERDSNQALVTWSEDREQRQVVIPVRQPSGEVIPNSGVEVLSDLVFWLCGLTPPRVRRGRRDPDSELERLSLRDLLWYCYLDQDSMDSSFFHLDQSSDQFKRLKSRNVLRYLLGYHQEHVAELEDELDGLRSERLRLTEAVRLLRNTLEDVGVSSEHEITSEIDKLTTQLDQTNKVIAEVRLRLRGQVTHSADVLRNKAREILHEIEAIELAETEVKTSQAGNARHLNELYTMSTKYQRTSSARAVLSKVDFERCPRCSQSLPDHDSEVCPICGQEEVDSEDLSKRIAEIGKDLDSRKREIREVLLSQKKQLRSLRIRLTSLKEEKAQIDSELSRVSEQYDSAYLSEALEYERKRAALDQGIRYLKKLRALPSKLESMLGRADDLASEETRVFRELTETRKRAEKDTKNLQLLADLFLDCLVRVSLPNISEDDEVKISHTSFLPEVFHVASGDTAVTSYQTMGSGGKKTMFKTCFALAVHRMATSIGASLPTVLVVDSPMKNISERENRKMFEGFHKLVYDLSEGELARTQFVLADKEYCPPVESQAVDVRDRYLTLDDPSHPPLISYYRG